MPPPTMSLDQGDVLC